MSDLVVIPANVLASANNTGFFRGTIAAGVNVAQGDTLAKDTAGAIILADANGSAQAKVFEGVALTAGAGGQPVDYVKEDPDFNPGATVTEGEYYILSATPGKIAPVIDKASGWASTLVGVGKAGNKLNLKAVPGGTLA